MTDEQLAIVRATMERLGDGYRVVRNRHGVLVRRQLGRDLMARMARDACAAAGWNWQAPGESDRATMRGQEAA